MATKIEHLQEILNDNKLKIFAKRKKLCEVKDRLAKVEKKVEREIIEASQLIMEAFKAFEECTDMKVYYAIKAFIVGYVECHKRVARHFLERNLTFLDKDESMSEEDQSLVEPRVAGVDFAPIAIAKDAL